MSGEHEKMQEEKGNGDPLSGDPLHGDPLQDNPLMGSGKQQGDPLLGSGKHSSYNALSPQQPSSEEDGEMDIHVEQGQSRCSACCDAMFPSGFISEVKCMFTITWPIVVTQICQMIIGPISLIFCGHLGDAIKLDGAALAISMINATCIAVGQGLATACDTFFSQTFGSKNKKMVGVYLQKSFLIFPLVYIPCAAVHMNLGLFLTAVGQNPEASRLAGDYMLIFIPGSFSFFMYVILAKYIQNQNIVIPNVIIGLTANAINAILHYVFLYQLDWGTDGSAIAQSVAYVCLFLMTLGYILISGVYKDTWDGWSWECLQDWGRFVRLAIPGMLMLCMEWWGFEIGVFLTGLLGTTELGAQSVLLQLDSIWFQVPLGIQIACAIRVGQYLGAGNTAGAKTVSRLALLLVVILSVIATVIFITFRYQLPFLFTNITEVAELTGDLLPIVAIYVFFDGVATACKGVLYGTGRQIYGAALLFISYYVLALPMGIPLMFLTDLKNAGYWWALAFNLILQAFVLTIIVFRTNWERQAEKAMERAGMIGEDVESDDSGSMIVPDEKTPLVSSRSPTVRRPSSSVHRERRGSRLLSASLSKKEIEVLLNPTNELSKTQLIIRRLAVLIVMLGVLVGGILIRVFVPLPEGSPEPTDIISPNVTEGVDFGNLTTQLPDALLLFNETTASAVDLFL